jgi:hypothetical protein
MSQRHDPEAENLSKIIKQWLWKVFHFKFIVLNMTNFFLSNLGERNFSHLFFLVEKFPFWEFRIELDFRDHLVANWTIYPSENFWQFEKGNFDSLKRKFLTVWKGKFLTVWKGKFLTVWKGKFLTVWKGNFDSLKREIFLKSQIFGISILPQ